MSREDWERAKSEVDNLLVALEVPDDLMSDKDFQAVLRALSGCSHDSGRQAVVQSLVARPGLLTADQMGQILNLFSLDSGREAALNFLGTKIANPSELLHYTHTMSHDSGRMVLVKWAAHEDRAVVARKAQTPTTPASRTVMFLLGVLVGAGLAALLLL